MRPSHLQPLACVSVADTWLSYVGSAQGTMFLNLAVPTLAVQDRRPGAAPEAALVLSTADPTVTAERAAAPGAAQARPGAGAAGLRGSALGLSRARLSPAGSLGSEVGGRGS